MIYEVHRITAAASSTVTAAVRAIIIPFGDTLRETKPLTDVMSLV